MDRGGKISWVFYLILMGGILSFILYYEYFYKIDWVDTNTFFQYSLESDGIYIKIENERDLKKLFDMKLIGLFRPFNNYKDVLSKYGDPIKYKEEKGVEYATYIMNKARVVYYGEHHEDRNYITLKVKFVDINIEDFIINENLRRLIVDSDELERIWVCNNDETEFFIIVDYPSIEEVHWNYTKHWGIPY
ncbi:MAG: hypothetical protein ACE5D4_08155 [Thermodesulfobacteriota bacterium]